MGKTNAVLLTSLKKYQQYALENVDGKTYNLHSFAMKNTARPAQIKTNHQTFDRYQAS